MLEGVRVIISIGLQRLKRLTRHSWMNRNRRPRQHEHSRSRHHAAEAGLAEGIHRTASADEAATLVATLVADDWDGVLAEPRFRFAVGSELGEAIAAAIPETPNPLLERGLNLHLLYHSLLLQILELRLCDSLLG